MSAPHGAQASMGGAGGAALGIAVNENDDVQLSLLCRVCGNKNDNLIPIFQGDGLANNLAEKIHSYLPIKIDVNDALPAQLCHQCANRVISWHSFFQSCAETNAILNNKLSRLQSKLTNYQENNLHNAQNDKSRSLRDTNAESAPNYKNIFITHNTLGTIKINLDEKYIPENKDKCSFCEYAHKDINVRMSHMLDFHQNFFFNCDECDTYVDRSQLIPHMSQHAIQCDDESTMEDAEVNPSKIKTQEKGTKTKENENDAFSTSSHSNDRFGPLPDSVFEAIKDTEEGIVEPLPKTLEQSCEDMEKMSEKLSSRNTATKSKVCPICSKTFRVDSSYHYHMKHFHGGVKKHECNVCGRSFSVKSALTNHLALHSEEKPYSCPACSKQFRSKASIYIHYNNVHCEKKKFSCTLCNRSFKWKQKLSRHIASHTKEKKYFCTNCNRGFGVKYDLTRHMKTHVNAKTFYCDKCGMSFAQRRYLKKHSERKHSVST